MAIAIAWREVIWPSACPASSTTGAISIGDDDGGLALRHRGFLQALDIHVDEHHAMGMQAGKIGVDEIGGNLDRSCLRHADGREQVSDEVAEALGGNRSALIRDHATKLILPLASSTSAHLACCSPRTPRPDQVYDGCGRD